MGHQKAVADRSSTQQSEDDSTQRTIRVSPDEIIFTQVVPNIVQVETVTLTNTLGSAVDLILKCSNPERLEVTPKQIRLMQSQTQKVEIKLCQIKPFHTKALKFKDFLFIKGDYFDQKVQITIFPSSKTVTTNSSASLQRDISNAASPQQCSIPLAGDSFGRKNFINDLKVGSNFADKQALRNSFDQVSEDDTEFLREKVSSLAAENFHLKEMLDQSQNDLSQYKHLSFNSADQLENIREMLREREPNLQKLLDEAMRQEKQKQERKELKVLEILQFKDRQIEELQKKMAEPEATLNQLRSELQAQVTKNARLQEKLDQSLQQLRSLDLQLKESKDLLQDFSQTDLMKTQAQLQSQSAYIRDLETQLKSVQNDGFLAEALDRSKHEINLKDTQFKQITKELETLRQVNSKLESQQLQFRDQLDEAKRNEQKLKLKSQSKKVDEQHKIAFDRLKSELAQYELKQKTALKLLASITADPDLENTSIEVCAGQIVKFVQRLQTNLNSQLQSTDALQTIKHENLQLKQQIGQLNSELLKAVDTDQDNSTIGGDENSELGHIVIKESLQIGQNSSTSQKQLNHKIQEMRVREGQLIDQLTHMKQHVQYRSSTNSEEQITDQDSQTDKSFSRQLQATTESMAVRIGELEHVIFQQREQMVGLEEELIQLKRARDDSDKDQLNKIQLLDLRNKNLQQLNRKIDTAYQVQSQSDLFGSLLSNKSPITHADTERMRLLTTDHINNLELKHKCQELTVQRDQLQATEKALAQQCDRLMLELAKVKHEITVKEVGLTGQDSKLTALIQDQKERILQLEHSIKSQASPTDISLIRIREEYLQKIEQLSQAVDNERQQISSQLIQATQKVENLKAQIHHMEKKELKAYQELEQHHIMHEQKKQKWETSQVEIQNLIEAKNQLIQGLERDLQQKERTLQERQEQLSVLLSALDNSNGTQTDQKQKIANLAAELCNAISDKSGLEKKINEVSHLERQSYLQSQRLLQEVDTQKTKHQKVEAINKTYKTQIESLERKLADLEQQFGEYKNKLSDAQFSQERYVYMVKQKDEMVQTLKEQLRKVEQSFRDEVQSIKQSLVQKNFQNESRVRQRDNHLRVAIQKLHLLLLEREDLKPRDIILEMEKTLSIAAQTIDKLQQDIEHRTRECQLLDQDWDACTLNAILTQKYELSMATLRRFRLLVQQRDAEQAAFIKCTVDQSLNHLVRDLEYQLESQQASVAHLTEEVVRINAQRLQAVNQNEIFKTQVAQFDDDRRQEKEQMLLKAEINLDERFRAKEEAIITYFDNRLSKLLMGSQTDRGLEIGREVCVLKMQIMNLKKVNQLESSKKESAELALRTAKQTLIDNQMQISSLLQKISGMQQKQQTIVAQHLAEQEKIKKASLKVEKELIKQQELTNQKLNEISMLKIQFEKNDEVLDSAKPYSHTQAAELSKRIQELQEEVIDLRQNRMLEIDELRLQYELEVAQTKRSLSLQQNEIERRFSPGSEPGEIINQNHELRNQINEFQQNEASLRQENDQLRRQCQDAEIHAENMSREVEEIKQSMIDVESVLMCNNQFGSGADDLLKSSNLQNTDTKRSKSALKKSKISQTTIQTVNSPTFEMSFVRNPPLLVRALVAAKINEHQAKAKLRRQLSTEQYLRQQLSQKLAASSDIVSDLINQNDTILQILNQQQTNDTWQNPADFSYENCEDDYNCLVVAVLALSNELAKSELQSQIEIANIHEMLPTQQVLQAQRVVIKALTEKQGGGKQIRYAPERDLDRKIWLLELLESQVNDAESQTDRLVDFIKRLQVAVSGNLQSAAEIRATSIDLANNTKEASEEIKTLRHVAALIKHDIQQQQLQNTNKSISALNPFQDQDVQRSTMMMTGRAEKEGTQSHMSLDKIMTERDSAQNQLSLTSKIKQSLEQELVNIKLHHATEIQSYIQNIKCLKQDNNHKLSQIEDVQNKLNHAQKCLDDEQSEHDNCKRQVTDLQQQLSQALQRVEKQAGSTSSLRKLQQDMAEWRKMSEQNLRNKQEALDTAQQEVGKLKSDITKIKAENQMLRRVQQDQRNGEEISSLLKEIESLKQQCQQSQSNNAAELEALTKEKAQLQQNVEKLQSIIQQGDSMAAQEATKLMKKLTTLSHELKSKQTDLTSLKDQLTQAQLEKVDFERKISEQASKISKMQVRLDDLNMTQKTLQSEKEELFKQKLSMVDQQDNGAAQIANEMLGLRETFIKLKSERDSLYEQLSKNQSIFDQREKDWRVKLQEIELQLSRQENMTVFKQSVENESLQVLTDRNKALVNDLKYFKEVSEKSQQKFQDLIEKQSAHDAQLLAQQQEQQGYQIKIDELRKELREVKTLLAEKEHMVRQAGVDAAETEAAHNAQLKQLNYNCSRVRVETQAAIQSLAQQLYQLKQKGADKKPVKEVDQALQVVQKEATIKLLKKELTCEKQKVQKLKSQKAELKAQIALVAEQPKQKKIAIVQPQLAKWKEDVLEMLSDSSNLKKALKSLRDCNSLEGQVIELQNQCTQSEANLYTAQQQLEEMLIKVDDLQQVILEQKHSAKDGKSVLVERHNAQVSSLKEQVKSLQQELNTIKNEFVSPDETQPLLDQIKEYQQNIKQAQADLIRKNKLISSLRQQKDSAGTELELVMQDLKGLRDDNMRLQKALREGRTTNSELKEMRETYDWLQKQEKQIKEELVVMHEKNKTLKSELTRKDSQLKEYKDQFSQRAAQNDTSKELQLLIQKHKEEKKRIKLELEISQNQVRTLKQQIENNKQQPDKDKSSQPQLEQELKQSRQKAKKYEHVLRKSINVISKVGTGLVRLAPDDSSSRKQSVGSEMMTLSQPDYRDAGEILGVSMHDLQDFINPTPGKQSQNSIDSQNQRRMIKKLQMIEQMPDTLDGDIDEIGEYCVKLLDEIQQNQQNN